MKFKKSQDDMFVLSYLKKIKLEHCRTINKFWEILYRKHDKSIVDRLKKIVNDRAEKGLSEEDLYTVKNQTLELSIDFTTFSTELYRRYFEWFIKKKNLYPKTILDIGCDNGIIPCFYATLFPETEVIGIDMNEAAIECANKLKERLELTNVHFKLIDVSDISDHFRSGYFDMITSIRTLHEIINFPGTRYWSINDVIRGSYSTESIQILDSLRSMLNTVNGTFINFERIPTTDMIAWWISKLHKSGLYIDMSSCQKIEFSEVGDLQIMPVLVTNLTYRNLPTDIDILTFLARNAFIDFDRIKEYEDNTAELAFVNCQNKELLFGSQVNYADKSGNMRYELWESEEYLLLYVYTNIGYRKLVIAPKQQLSDLKNMISETVSSVAAYGNKTFSYTTLEERENHPLYK